jgi:hypothetical protein
MVCVDVSLDGPGVRVNLWPVIHHALMMDSALKVIFLLLLALVFFLKIFFIYLLAFATDSTKIRKYRLLWLCLPLLVLFTQASVDVRPSGEANSARSERVPTVVLILTTVPVTACWACVCA